MQRWTNSLGKHKWCGNSKEVLVVLHWTARKEASCWIPFKDPKNRKTEKWTEVFGDFWGGHEHKEENYDWKIDFRGEQGTRVLFV